MSVPSQRPRRRATAPASLLAAALRAQSAGVCVAECHDGAALRIVFTNDSFCALSGYSRTQLNGRDYDRLHVDRTDVDRVREWVRTAKPGQPLTGEGFLVRADGGTIAVAWSIDVLRDAAGAATHVVATYRDQTEKRRLQEALVHSQRLDAVGRLAGGVAHDFNNLVSIINGYCEILATHVAGQPQAMRELTEIHQAGRKAAALTQQLLAFSRRQPFDARVLNLNQLIEENAAILRRLIGDAGKLDLELARELPNVRTDAAQFQQVLLNLVLNARDALRDRGRIVITTTTRELKPQTAARGDADLLPGRYVSLTVADNGTGMDAETMKHLFEPFFTTKTEGKGTGLGLALVYGVVKQSAGAITVSSELLVGSKFEILLPTVDAPAEPPTVTAVSPLPSLRGNETVWFVESDDVVRKMVAGMLTADGYRVSAFSDASEAPRDPAACAAVQLFIGNLRGEGEALARQIAAQRPDVRLLVIGEHEDDAVVAWHRAEHQARLNKPYALSELLRASRQLLDARLG